MASAFSFPAPAEIAPWLRSVRQSEKPADIEKMRRDLRIRSYVFTTSAMIPGIASLVLATQVSRVGGRTFWILYIGLLVASVVTLIASRELVAHFWPRPAVIYYACAALDRLSPSGPPDKSDRRYLSLVLAGLESALLNPRLFRDLAGTSEARALLHRLQSGLVNKIGAAELNSIRRGEDVEKDKSELKAAIGTALAAVHTNAVKVLDDPGAPAVDQKQAETRRWGWLSVMVSKAQEKSIELLIVTAAAAILPLLLKINN
jgi:hypothetical protein